MRAARARRQRGVARSLFVHRARRAQRIYAAVIKLLSGEEYEVAHAFGDDRALVLVEEGIYVFADRVTLDAWMLSDVPARPGEEQKILLDLVKGAPALEVTVTKEDAQ